MKKALFKDSVAEIKKSFGRFISILLIVMLGVAFFAGLRATCPDMHKTADDYFDEYALSDIHILSTMGFSENDIAAIGKNGYVEEVIPGYSTDVLVNHDGQDEVIKLYGISEKDDALNKVKLCSGRMPQKEDECVILRGKTKDSGLSIGDKVTFKSGKGDIKDTLKNDTYSVVGVVDSPYLISFDYGSSTIGSGTVVGVAFLSEKCFSTEVYTDVYITVKGAKKLNCFSEEYDALIEEARDSLNEIASVRDAKRYDDIILDAQKQIEESQSELDDKKSEAEKELENAKNELIKNKNKLALNEKSIKLSEQELITNETAADEKLKEAKNELLKNKAAYEESLAEYNKNAEQYNKSIEELNKAQSELDGFNKLIEKSKSDLLGYKESLKDVNASLAAVNDNISAIDEALSDSSISEEKRQELLKRKEQCEATKRSLEAQKAALNTAIDTLEPKIVQMEGTLQIQQAAFNENKAKLDAVKKQLSYANESLNGVYSALNAAEEKLNAEELQLKDTFLNAREQLSSAKGQIDAAKKKLNDGNKEYEDKKKEAAAKFKDAQTQIDDAKKQLDDLKKPVWYVQDRSSACYGYSDYVDAADRMDAMARVFPALFLIVAALVSLNAMTRMVEEQRMLIGTLKGLGYGNGAIALKYIIYAALASVVGSVVGVFLGIRIFPSVIFYAYGIMFNMPSLVIGFYPATAVTSAAIAVVITTLAAYIACSASLKSYPAKLMRPKAPKAGKRVLLERIGFIWKRMSFTKKVTARNLFRYKKRCIMTVFGIGAAVALLLVGFGVKDSVTNILIYQFDDIYNYDLMVTTNGIDAEEYMKSLEKENGVSGCTSGFMKSAEIELDGQKVTAVLTAFDSKEDINGFITLRNRITKQPVELEDGGVVLTEKMANILGAKAGDTVYVVNGAEKTPVKVEGITEHYAMHYAYMTTAQYEEYFGEKCEKNVIYAHLEEDCNEDLLAKNVLKTNGVINVSFISDIFDTFSNMLESLNFVVLVLIVSAAALCFLVLYNLTNINVSERYREIATIKVLGFYDNEVLSYVYRENFILTGIGIILGCIGGTFLHSYVIHTVEVSSVMFGRVINPLSYVYAALLTVGFALAVNFVMYFKLKKIDMVEALKSVE